MRFHCHSGGIEERKKKNGQGEQERQPVLLSHFGNIVRREVAFQGAEGAVGPLTFDFQDINLIPSPDRELLIRLSIIVVFHAVQLS